MQGLKLTPLFVPFVYFAVSIYLYSWFVRMLKPGRLPRRLIAVSFFILVVSFPVSKVLGHFSFNSFSHFLSLFSCIWMGATLFLGLAAAVLDLLFFVLRRTLGSPETLRSPSFRRKVFAGVCIGVLVITCYGVREAANIRVHRMDLALHGLPEELDGLTLVQISDVHYGMITENGRLWRIVNRINDLQPDLVVITGDLVDEGVSHMEEMAEPLARLKSPRGVFAIAGNHEFYAGVDRAVGIMKSAGIRVLRNEKVTLPGGLQILGIDDPYGCRRAGIPPPDFDRILSTVDRAHPSILLFHPPTNFQKASEGGIGLQLSGHTHGAQFLPIRPVARILYPQFRGLFCNGDSFLYVNRGVGFGGPPMRLGSPPEITLIRFHAPGKMKNAEMALLTKAKPLNNHALKEKRHSWFSFTS